MKAASRPPALTRTKARSRLYLGAGLALFVAAVVGVILLKPRTVPYTPGSESATSGEITSRLSREVPEEAPRIQFIDAAEEAGLRFRHFGGRRSTQLPEDMGSGVAWGDYDGDGDPDLYLVNISGPLSATDEEIARSPARSALFRNEGGSFTDVTDEAGAGVRGAGMAAAWGDYDGDGDLDLFVTRFGTNVLFRNTGEGAFEDVTTEAGLGDVTGFWAGASWADYDRDGDSDLYVCGYVRYRYDEAEARRTSRQYNAVVPYTLNPSTYSPERNLLYRNDGGHFREVAAEAGVENTEGRSLSASWADFDGDGWPDLYVANDISDNVLFRNTGDGRFDDISHSAWVADYRGAMGLAVGDRDNDGDLDLFVSHWIAQENALYDNLSGEIEPTPSEPMHFIDNADLTGLGQIGLDFIGWGTGFFDYDNDGRLDLFVANGSTFQREDDPARLVPMRNLLFWNAGKEKGFFEIGGIAGEAFQADNVGRGAAFADYDADGNVDLVLIDHGGNARLLRNEGSRESNWVRLVLRGPGTGDGRQPERNSLATSPFATGARVTLLAEDLSLIREVGGGSSYLGQNPPGEVHFGLGRAERIERVEIRWPDGSRQSFSDLPVNTTIRIGQGGEPEIPIARRAASSERAPMRSEKEDLRRFWTLFREATNLRVEKEFELAASRYESALALDGRHEDSLYYLGHCRWKTGEYTRARSAFEALLSVNPESARGHATLGALLASPDPEAPFEPAEAERHFRQAHRINRESTGHMVRLGELLIVQDRLEEAGNLLEAATLTNHWSVEAAFLAGFVRWESGDRDRAREYYRRALQAAAPREAKSGVAGEGDRLIPTAEGGKIVAGPLQSPLGATLFESLLPGADSTDLEASFSRVRARARALAARSGADSGL
jgi:hypothetical protein